MENSRGVKAKMYTESPQQKSVLKSGLHTKVCRKTEGQPPKWPRKQKKKAGYLETKKGRLVSNLLSLLYINIPLVTTGSLLVLANLDNISFYKTFGSEPHFKY